MNEAKDKDALERVRETRHRISEKFNHDPKKLIAHYIELQQSYKHRIVNTKAEKEVEESV